MVSADNLNYDVLEVIFAFLSGNDLPSVALVSRSFLAGIIPRLYSKIAFRESHAKRYPRVMTPFASIVAHPDLASHTRADYSEDIRCVPMAKGLRVDMLFLRDCVKATELCHNIVSFTCLTPYFPAFIVPLQFQKRLKSFRISAHLSAAQSEKLVELSGPPGRLSQLESITLDNPSGDVLNVLPKLTCQLKDTLTTLVLFNSIDLNETVLQNALLLVPSLTGLHVISCPKIDHIAALRLLHYTPNLDSLSMMVTDNTCPLPFPAPSLYRVRNLSLELRSSQLPSSYPSVLSAVLDCLKASYIPLESFIIRSSQRKTHSSLNDLYQLLNSYASTLRRLAFVDCTVSLDILEEICKKCNQLERLELSLSGSTLALSTSTGMDFMSVLSRSKSLRTLIDLHSHVSHGPR
ncbi:hypothetical protein FISHEDRAFT_45143 [Fistulina hepatica ATCC 64428]|uniref:F-box domain-containing protein n=1 Tax=Fistulina hepatica ATCC 64428 TaxID=1128425 RepID=A0A0D7A9Z5_9AGAR|nr:hypothetical protein FISHEDRAFT_45143 [Fistulina hepatica ATCC 64428]